MPLKAVLLVGPTGSGKTPLGRLLEREGLNGTQCLHFDFGDALRWSAKQPAGTLTPAERIVVEESLRTGALLENEQFHIAKKLLSHHLTGRNAGRDTLVILNGIPRHTSQAEAMLAVVEMQMVVSLECESAVVWERIKTNAGGDRGGRVDDTLEEVEKRVELFRKRTAPLLEYYGETGVSVLPLGIGVGTTAQEMRLQILASWPGMVRR